MRARSIFPALSAASVLFLGTAGSSRAALSPADAARRSAIVAHVGVKEITAGELEDRIAKIPRFQLAAMGDTPGAIRRKVLLDVIVPEVLLATAAEKEHLEGDPALGLKLQRALANATMRVVRNQVGLASAIPTEDIRKYYVENKSKFDSPARYNLWRILCATRDEALSVLASAKATLTIENFSKLARDHSIDKATYMQAGNLGFVDEAGSSNEVGVKIDPRLAKAAAGVKDGELLPDPVPEGSGFAVVWRRGSVPANHRSLEDATPQIRDVVWRQRIDEASMGLLDGLRLAHVADLNDALLNGIEVSATDGQVMPRRRPGQVPPLRQADRLPQKPQ
jgi:peptidyl-prolyl cis-trans isomerase C